MSQAFISDRRLEGGYRLRFGACGERGIDGEVTHQKVKPALDAYNHYFYGRPEFYPRRVLEIGVCRGGSLNILAWSFPASTIVGVDEHDQRAPWVQKLHDEMGIVHVTGRMPEAVPAVLEHGPFDLIIDDAGHGPTGVFPSFEAMWPRLNPGGVYAIEDWSADFLEPAEVLWYLGRMVIGGDFMKDEAGPETAARMVVYRGAILLEKREG